MMNNIEKAKEIIKSKSALVFDFDGVIVDSFDVKKTAFSNLYLQYGEDIANKVLEFHDSGNGGMCRVKKFKFFHENYLNTELSEIQLDEFCKNFSKQVVKNVIDSEEILGVIQFIETYCLNKRISIVNSATPQDEMHQIVHERGLEKFFNEVYGSPKTKVENFHHFFSKFNLKPDKTVFFGDLIADFHAAESVGCDFIGIGDRIDADLVASISTNQYAFLDNFENI